jgi:hypothetical protein
MKKAWKVKERHPDNSIMLLAVTNEICTVSITVNGFIQRVVSIVETWLETFSKTVLQQVGFEVLRAVSTKMAVFLVLQQIIFIPHAKNWAMCTLISCRCPGHLHWLS